jgi:hypothetical protein
VVVLVTAYYACGDKSLSGLFSVVFVYKSLKIGGTTFGFHH